MTKISSLYFLFIYRKLNLDLVPRQINGPLAVDPKETNIVELYKVHEKSAENAKTTNVSLK
jgi:hypothetical protein